MRVAAAASILAALACVAPARADPLDTLKGRARPVVVLSDSRHDPRVAKQIAALDSTKAEVSDRDIQVLWESEQNGPLRRRLGVETKGFAVVLVGKDGTVKKVWRHPVDPKAIFTIIDAMPMRRQEMNR